MTRALTSIAIAYVAAVFELALAPRLAWGAATPDIFVLGLAIACWTWSDRSSWGPALGIGLLADLTRGVPVGTSLGGMLLAAELFNFVARHESIAPLALRTLAVGCAAALVAAWSGLVLLAVKESNATLAGGFLATLACGVSTAATAAPCWLLYGWMTSGLARGRLVAQA